MRRPNWFPPDVALLLLFPLIVAAVLLLADPIFAIFRWLRALIMG
jgi:hypothetical protein